MTYYLAKSDPETYSIEQLQKDGTTTWDGVHNYAALIFIKAMKPGDLIYFYQSQTDKAIVGLMEVVGEPYKNEKDPRTSFVVDVKFKKKYTKHVTLADIKAEPLCADFALVKQSRLSVMPVPPAVQQWLDTKLA
ncbi:MAG: EVE domain-containing protein [Weeksellaceae bacterium]